MKPISFVRWKSVAFCASVALVVWLAFLNVYGQEYDWLSSTNIVAKSRAITLVDKVDVPILYASLATKPTFASTWAWWHTSWTLTVPYWRPLSIQAFWLEKHFFTLDRLDRWMWLSLALHLVCSGLLGVFAYLLTRRRDVALLTVALYTIIISFPSNWGLYLYAPGLLANWNWKDQVDLFADTCTFSALIAALTQRYWMALAGCTLAVCFKESGWLAFALVVALLTYRGELRRVPVSVTVAVILTVATLLALRWSAGPQVWHGYHDTNGVNHHWISRYATATSGIAINTLFFNPGTAVVGVALLGLIALRNRVRLAGLCVYGAASVGAFLLIECLFYHFPLLDGIGMLSDPAQMTPTIVVGVIFAFTLGAIPILARRPHMLQLAIFVLFCDLLSATMYVAAVQNKAHTLHLATGFQCLLNALVIVCYGDALLAKITANNHFWRHLGRWAFRPQVGNNPAGEQ